MSTAISSLHELLCSMCPVKNEGVYAFVSVPLDFETGSLDPVATFRELEGLTVVVEEQRARQAGLKVLLRASWITLQVHSDLRAVGLTAAVASALARADISCNVLAGAHHDHIFVPVESADSALATLRALQARSQPAPAAGDRQDLSWPAQEHSTPIRRPSSLAAQAPLMGDASLLSCENERRPGARFVAADLTDSHFEDVSLRGAVFRNVALSGASFHDVDLGNTSFTDANLDGMRVNGVLVSDLFRAYYQVNPR